MSIIDYLTKNFTSIISLLTAILSAYFAFRSTRISKKALSIAEIEYSSRQSKFQLYLVDNYRYILKDKRILLFNISINNQSDSPNSFKAILEIEFVREDNSVVRIQIGHEPNLLKEISKSDLIVFEKDIRLEERCIKTNWLVFEEPKNFFEIYKIDKYRIKISDVYENQKQLEALFIKSIQL